MAFGTKVSVEPVREVAFGGISGTYAVVGTPLARRGRIVNIHNGTDAQIYVSLDGVNNHFRLAVAETKVLDLTTDRVDEAGFFIGKGTQFWVKQVTAPGVGAMWIEVIGAAANGGI